MLGILMGYVLFILLIVALGALGLVSVAGFMRLFPLL